MTSYLKVVFFLFFSNVILAECPSIHILDQEKYHCDAPPCVAIVIDPSCKKEELNAFVHQLSTREAKESWQQTLELYFEKSNERPSEPVVITNSIQRETSLSFDSVHIRATNANQTPNTPDYVINFDPKLLGKKMVLSLGDIAPEQDNIFSDREAANLISGGIAIVNIIQSGAFKNTANQFRMGWKALFYEMPTDYIAKKFVSAYRQGILSILQTSRQTFVNRAQHLSKKLGNIQLLTEIETKNVHESLSQGKKTTANIVEYFKQRSTAISKIPSKITTIYKKAVEKYEAVEKESRDIRKGLLPPKVVNQFNRQMTSEINDTKLKDGLPFLTSMFHFHRKEKNPHRKAQYGHILRSHLNDAGIVATWASLDSITEGVSFGNPIGTERGDTIRAFYNEGLKVRIYSSDERVKNKAGYALDLLTEADRAFTTGKRRIANRKLNRARMLIDYLIGHKRVNGYKQYRLSKRAKKFFGINANANTFEGAMLVDIGSRLYKERKIKRDPLNKFYAKLAIRQVFNDSKKTDIDQFGRALDNAWGVLDYAKGFTKGLWMWTLDTVTGAYEMLRHPVDSAQTIYHALVNYDRTYEVIKSQLSATVKNYDSMSTSDKASLHAKILGEIGSNFIGVGAIVKVGKLDKFGSLVSKSNKIKNMGKYWSLKSYLHVLKGDTVIVNGVLKLRSGLHSHKGLRGFIKKNQLMGRQYQLKEVSYFVEKNLSDTDILIQKLPNGVQRVHLPRNVWENSKAYGKAIITLENGSKIRGIKSLWPDKYTPSDVSEATKAVLTQNIKSTDSIIYGSYKNISIKVIRDTNTGKVLTSHPRWIQP